jgi:NADPH2:quinone reductase
MKAIVVSRYGGPEVLEFVDTPDPELVDGHALYEVRAAAINYADTHQIGDKYLRHMPLPFTPGMGFVGLDSDGKRVAGVVRHGAYAERIAIPPSWAAPIPDAISELDALALLLHGVSAWHVLRTFGRLTKGDAVVVHAGAGGVGTFAVQLAKRWGAGRVIATASTEEKRRLTLELGADVAVDSRAENLTAALLDANGGKPVEVVLESAGGRVFDQSLAALGPFGRMVVYGNTSQEPPTPVRPEQLMDGSRTLSGFWFSTFAQRPAALEPSLVALYKMVAKGELKPVIGGRYPLSEARRAHEEMRGRQTFGVQVLEMES